MLDAPKNKLRAGIRPLNPATLALTSGGLGFLRPAPGSWGSLPPVLLAFFLLLAGATPLAFNITLVSLLLFSGALCILLGRYAEARFGRKDAAEVVLDETAGQSLPLLFLPSALHASSDLATNAPISALFTAATACAAAFLFFRIADILKPWPARSLERLPHGWGVLADDLAAALYASLALQLLLRLRL